MDLERVDQAIINAPVSPTAREEAAPLVAAWITRMERWEDTNDATVAVEVPFRLWLDSKTLAIGVVDRITSGSMGPYPCEWKTRRAPKVKKNGEPYAGDTESDWSDEILGSVQPALYALASMEAEFVGVGKLKQANGKVLCRAVVKSSPPQFWTAERTYDAGTLGKLRSAFLSKAAQIRAARAEGLTPWQLPGAQCVNRWNRTCEFLSTCKVLPTVETLQPVNPPFSFDPSDPAYAAIKDLDLPPDVVILSASLYGTYAQCAEKGRLVGGGYFAKEPSIEMEIGTAVHAGLAEIYRPRSLQ